MLPSERQQQMLDLLTQQTIVTIPEFTACFKVSVETVRRDLAALSKQGHIQKVYGGAKLRDVCRGEPSMETRLVQHLREKEAIGRKCSEYVNDGDCIFIDSGSTTFHIARHLTAKRNLTVITNSLPVIQELTDCDCELIIIGGRIRRQERSIVSDDYLFQFSQLNIQKSFLCASGISLETGVSDFNMQEAVTRKRIIERSKQIFVAADSSKFEKDVTITILPLSQVDYIVSDSAVPRSFSHPLKKLRPTLLTADA